MMYMLFSILNFGSPVEPATLQVTNDNLPAHLANLLSNCSGFAVVKGSEVGLLVRSDEYENVFSLIGRNAGYTEL